MGWEHSTSVVIRAVRPLIEAVRERLRRWSRTSRALQTCRCLAPTLRARPLHALALISISAIVSHLMMDYWLHGAWPRGWEAGFQIGLLILALVGCGHKGRWRDVARSSVILRYASRAGRR